MLRAAWRNLVRSPGRTILTLLGVAGSVSLYVTLAGISHGYRTQLDESLSRCQVDVVVQAKAAANIASSRITAEDIARLRALDGVDGVTPLIMGSVRAREMPYLLLFGVENLDRFTSLAEWLDVGLVAGAKYRPGRREFLVGQRSARKYGLSVGDEIVIGEGEAFLVAGIFALGLDIIDGALLADMSLAQEVLQRKEEFNLALLNTAPGAQRSAVLMTIHTALPHLSATAGEQFRSRIRAISLIDTFILTVTTVAFLLSGLVVLNTLVLALAERTGEIGILMVVGWSRSMVVRMILVETLLLCCAGGALGFAVTWGVLPVLDLLPGLGAGWIPAAPPWRLLPRAMLLAATTAVCSAIYPALHSTRLSPVQALKRY